MSFSDLTVRSNGDDILASWFNEIRTALLDSSGTEQIAQTSYSSLASQTATDVTGLVFDKTVTRRALVIYTIVTSTKEESGTFVMLHDATNWTLYEGPVEGDDSLITFDVTALTGQVVYDSSTETGTIEFKASTLNL